MNCGRLIAIMMMILFPVSTYAANAFLDAKNDKPVSATFRGTQRSDEIEEEEIPFTVRVVTTRVSKMDWGGIFKIEFTDVTSRNPKLPQDFSHFIATDNRIVPLNEEG